MVDFRPPDGKTRHGDEYTFVVVPLVLGKGTTMFDGVAPLSLKRTSMRGFSNGKVVISYESIA